MARPCTDRAGDVARRGLRRTGVMSAIAVSVHNLPEGLVVFVAAMADPALGIVTAAAIALHNIPEGIATAAPIFQATRSRAKALAVLAGSGLTEPLGGLVGYLLLSQLVAHADDYRTEYNTTRPHEAIAWNRPQQVHLGLADPTTPNFPESQNLPTA